jgi:hypothetical protein
MSSVVEGIARTVDREKNPAGYTLGVAKLLAYGCGRTARTMHLMLGRWRNLRR